MFKRSAGIIAGSAVLVGVAATGSAFGATKTVSDHLNDAQPRFDITSATFKNAADRLSGKAHVVNLRYGGEQYFSFTFSPRNSPDVFYTAFSKLHADNSLTNRLTIFNDVGEIHHIPCNVTSVWRPGNDTVRVSIPRSCVEGLSGTQYMTANLGPSARRGTQDHVVARFVREG
jgi:hypothetical protein